MSLTPPSISIQYFDYLSKRTIPLADERSNLWYLKQKVGEKKLASFMKEIASKANFTGKY